MNTIHTATLLLLTLCIQESTAAEGTNTASPLRQELEIVYSKYLTAISNEDAKLLLEVLPTSRIADLKETFAANKMEFPADYFQTFKKYSPKLPPLDSFQFIATTESQKYANLIYHGNMKGYLRNIRDDDRFLVIQFEREPDGWKYAVIKDPTIRIVPNLQHLIEVGDLGFTTRKPFSAEKIELVP